MQGLKWCVCVCVRAAHLFLNTDINTPENFTLTRELMEPGLCGMNAVTGKQLLRV